MARIIDTAPCLFCGRVYAAPFDQKAGLSSVWRLIGLWGRLRAERRALALLGPDLLADIGVSALCAEVEARRRFWDVPAGRR